MNEVGHFSSALIFGLFMLCDPPRWSPLKTHVSNEQCDTIEVRRTFSNLSSHLMRIFLRSCCYNFFRKWRIAHCLFPSEAIVQFLRYLQHCSLLVIASKATRYRGIGHWDGKESYPNCKSISCFLFLQNLNAGCGNRTDMLIKVDFPISLYFLHYLVYSVYNISLSTSALQLSKLFQKEIVFCLHINVVRQIGTNCQLAENKPITQLTVPSAIAWIASYSTSRFSQVGYFGWNILPKIDQQ